jgi:predicted nucleic acid-binding protein
MEYFLDTNVFAIFFKPDKIKNDIEKKLSLEMDAILKDENGVIKFCISEVTSMEIYSVFGNLVKGKPKQENICSRILEDNSTCNKKWIEKAIKPFKINQIQQMEKLLKDVENQRGTLQAEVLNLDISAISEGRKLLQTYAHLYSLHSMDALIGGTLLASIKNGRDFIFITLDKKFRNVMLKEKVECIEIR